MSANANPRIQKNPFFPSPLHFTDLSKKDEQKGLGFFTERRRGYEKPLHGRLEELNLNVNHFGQHGARPKAAEKNSLALLNEYKEPEFDSLKLLEIQDKMSKDAGLLAQGLSSHAAKASPKTGDKPAAVGSKAKRGNVGKSKEETGRSVSKKSTSRTKNSSQSKCSRAARPDNSRSPKSHAGGASHHVSSNWSGNDRLLRGSAADFLHGIRNLKPSATGVSSKLRHNHMSMPQPSSMTVLTGATGKSRADLKSSETSKEKKSASCKSRKQVEELKDVQRKLFEGAQGATSGIAHLLSGKINIKSSLLEHPKAKQSQAMK